MRLSRFPQVVLSFESTVSLMVGIYQDTEQEHPNATNFVADLSVVIRGGGLSAIVQKYEVLKYKFSILYLSPILTRWPF